MLSLGEMTRQLQSRVNSHGVVKKISGVYYGWRMIGLVSALRVLGGGLHQYGFTVFFLPVTQDLGLSRAVTSWLGLSKIVNHDLEYEIIPQWTTRLRISSSGTQLRLDKTAGDTALLLNVRLPSF